ncbi:bacteriohemerythrin [Psychromonas sp. MME2]|uniref:bacteriohemerythrin n=1 Tax=unclassified Psychromonas TaxID=2614957 RepID=UPI00339D039B
MIDQHVDIFPWSDNFNIGIDKIDHQHKKLVELLNKVANIITLQRLQVSPETFINELLDYAVYHFKTEDKYWSEHLLDSIHIQQHRDSHNQFISRINALKAELGTLSEDEWLEELFSFLTSWLVLHILENDKHMAFLVTAVKSGQSLQEANRWAEEQIHLTAKDTLNVILSSYKNLSVNTMRMMREIKAKNVALNKLSKSERRLHNAMDYAQIGRWFLRYKDNTIEYDWSSEILHLFGFTAEIVPSQEALFSIMKEEFQQPFLSSIERCFETAKEHRVEYQIIRPSDGAVRWISSNGKLKYQTDGTVDRISGFIQDITERKASEEKITRLAYYDSLTSLPNRRLLMDRLHQLIAQSERNKNYNALFFIDLDDFKTVNDSYGHDYGDILLQQAATRIKQLTRKGDTLARIGGDEFVFVLSGLDEIEARAIEKAGLVVQKIVGALSIPYKIHKQQFNSSASIGVTLFNDSSTSVSQLMQFADIAMYQAKRLGKNSAYFYEPQLQQLITNRFNLERKLRNAIKEQQFELYYQPQMDDLDQVIGAEALIRWHDPIEGLISPDNFIPMAEKKGLIIPIGEWVLETACQQLQRWQQNDHTRHLTLAVNVSYKQFRQANFVGQVKQLVDTYGIGQGQLKIELTESILIDDMELIIDNMQELKALGIKFALDDFGTGYSSLQYLKRLPLNRLKIDRSFITELQSNINDQSIVKTIILMASALGLDVIAEGVETIEQRNYLYANGCLSYQGYLYSKPLTINDFEAYLLSNKKQQFVHYYSTLQ